MSEPQPQDAALASLAHRLGLSYAPDAEAWKWQARVRLGNDSFDRLQVYRSRLANDPSSEVEFYQFVTTEPAVTLAMLEGRLGYYDAVLPKIGDVLQGVPHARILDAGSYCGLVSMYLGQRFPDSRVLGIDRCAGAVARARELSAQVGLANVEFLHGDYNGQAPDGPFDVVLSLQTVPTYLLPRLPSELPESYQRGKGLEVAAVNPAAPVQGVATALASLRRLAGGQGHVVFHERLPDIPRAVLFFYLASRADLRVTHQEQLTWETANERAGRQQSPLAVARPEPGAAPFDESSVTDLFLPPDDHATYSEQQLDQGLILAGAQAERYFNALRPRCEDVCVQGTTADQNRFHVHLGVADGRRAYVYSCSTADYREFKICDARFARMLFSPVVEHLQHQQNTGSVIQVEPLPAALWQRLQAWFGW